MEDRKPESKPKAHTVNEEIPFAKKTLSAKVLFVCQVIIMVASGGFIFPTILD
jgi:hypothetical protein